MISNAEGDTDMNQPQPNINMNQRASSFNIDLGKLNFGAVGAVNRGAQGTTLQGLTVFAHDGFARIQGGSGSGGSHIAITVVGGKFGVDFRGSQPAATAAGFLLRNQSCGGILYSGLMSCQSSASISKVMQPRPTGAL